MSSPSTFATFADRLLEGTVVGSFSKIGYAAREQSQDWEPVTADLSGQRAIVTGATSGIGNAIAAGLHTLGADVVVTSRSQERADDAANAIASADASASGSVVGAALDTADLDSVVTFANLVKAGSPVDILVHNAGALTDSYRTNERGMEQTVASHLVGPHALNLLLEKHFAHGARIIWMSSGGMYTRGLDVENLECTEDNYRGAVAYANAKRAQVELVTHLGPKRAPQVIMQAMHPGWVDTPGVSQGLPGFGKLMGPLLRSPEQGADTAIWLAAGGGDHAPGSFWLDRNTRGTSYLPFTGTDDVERAELIEWLELVTLPALVG